MLHDPPPVPTSEVGQFKWGSLFGFFLDGESKLYLTSMTEKIYPFVQACFFFLFWQKSENYFSMIAAKNDQLKWEI